MTETNLFKTLDDAAELNILILGCSGMLGSSLFHQIPKISPNYKVYGTSRGGSKVPVETDRAKILTLGNIFESRFCQDQRMVATLFNGNV